MWQAAKYVVAGLVFIASIGFLGEQWVEVTSKQSTYQSLQLFLSLRHASLQDYFASVSTEINTTSKNKLVMQATQELSKAWQQLTPAEQADLRVSLLKVPLPDTALEQKNIRSQRFGHYTKAHAAFEPYAKSFIENFGYYDIFLISPQGDIVYTFAKEADFATNLLDGDYRDSSLGDVFRLAIKQVDDQLMISDYKAYAPSQNVPAIFCARRIVQNGTILGVLALQIPTERINHIMKFSAGMGESGETYLVGSDYLMRSQSRFTTENTLLTTKVASHTTVKALAGKRNAEITDDYRGIPVFSAYSPFDFGAQHWAMLAEKDVVEVIKPIRNWWIRAVLIAMGVFSILGLIFHRVAYTINDQ